NRPTLLRHPREGGTTESGISGFHAHNQIPYSRFALYGMTKGLKAPRLKIREAGVARTLRSEKQD
ncbi:hypothetical protein, partial [Vibrio sp. N418]|uniref:hypothetical protein n=1 Tax=Vibrio sp. (strain N418) TaxID=701176 RepID=UPI00167FB0BE